jgi:glycosyltransferase involved in cell wall biosynthesis
LIGVSIWCQTGGWHGFRRLALLEDDGSDIWIRLNVAAIVGILRDGETLEACVAKVVGDGPVREKLEQEHPWLRFAGMQSGEDQTEHYASADVLIFPSETETFGNVLLEGLASGLAVVGYDYAAAAQHVVHGRNGLKAPKGDEESFIVEAVAALGPRVQDEIQAEARQSAEALGWGRVIDTFEGGLGEIADRGRTPVEGTAWSSRKRKRNGTLDVRTVFISDVHLGTADS